MNAMVTRRYLMVAMVTQEVRRFRLRALSNDSRTRRCGEEHRGCNGRVRVGEPLQTLLGH